MVSQLVANSGTTAVKFDQKNTTNTSSFGDRSQSGATPPTQKAKQGRSEEEISERLKEFGDDIISIEFILDIESIAEVVQPETDNLLRGL